MSISALGQDHTVHLQVPSGRQVLHRAQAGYLQEQLHTVDCGQKEASQQLPLLSPLPGGRAVRPVEVRLKGHVGTGRESQQDMAWLLLAVRTIEEFKWGGVRWSQTKSLLGSFWVV
jgi:hypothetical protein